MKLETPKQNIAICGDFETTDFAIGDIAFVVDMFADKVYTHKVRAVIRELSCNAHDSHVVAGTTDTPFDVHLPTRLEPFFSVRDYGTGLNDHDIRNIFAGVGISTKRNNNSVIGCFGIGSLSPYALCDSFTVKSWLNGRCSTYSCYRDEQRKPVVALLTEVDSNEPNGLEVNLTIDGRVLKFEEEAVTVFQWWDKIPNINNKNVANRCDEKRLRYDFIFDDFGVTNEYGSMYAVMGNVAYHIPENLNSLSCEGYVRFDMGEISFDTARENLSLDDKTVLAIKTKMESVHSRVAMNVINVIKQEQSTFKRAVLAKKIRKGRLGLIVRSAKFNLEEFDLPETTEPIICWSKSYRSVVQSKTKNLPIGDDIRYFGYKGRMSTRIKNELKDSGHGKMIVVLTNEQIKECKIDIEFLEDLEDLPKVSRSTTITTDGKIQTYIFNQGYTGYDSRRFFNTTEIDCDGTEKVYIEISRYRPINGHAFISSCASQIKSTLKTMEKNKIVVPTVLALKSAFLNSKTFKGGNFIHLDDYVRRELGKVAPKTYHKFDKDDRYKLGVIVEYMESDRLNEFLELNNTDNDQELAGICKKIGLDVQMSPDTSLQEWMDKFFEEYEMLSVVDNYDIRTNREVVARYIGATIKG